MTLRVVAVALVVLGLLTVVALELANTQAKSRDDVMARVHERGTLAAALVDSLFESSAQQAPLNARRYGGRTVSDATLEANLRTNQYLILLDPRGGILAQTRGVTPAVRADLKRTAALGPRQAYRIGDTIPYGRTGVISYAIPVQTAYGRRTLVSGFTPATLASIFNGELRKIPGVKGSRGVIIDGRLTLLAASSAVRPIGYVYRQPEQIKALRQKSGNYGDRYFDQVAVANSSWHLITSAPHDALFATVSGVRKWVPWTIFVGFVVVTLVAFLLGRRALRASDQVRVTNDRLAVVNSELAESIAALGRRAAELARSNDELEQFASIASHDLQEPLRKVRTFAQQLTVIEADRLSDKGRDYLERTNLAAERMQRLIEDLLRFSRVATQTRPFAPVDLAVVTREVLEDLEGQVERSDGTVRIGDLPTISGDAPQMRQLMQNLISNALKFQRDGVPPEVDVDAVVHGEVATIRVRDNGIGFEPQYEQRIFRVFERLHGRGRYPGTGIGLALCRKIVERHGGTIEARGEPGAGSTFTIALPVDQREEVLAPAPPQDQVASVRSEDHVYA